MTKIKPVLETRDPGLSAGCQKIQKRPSFCVEIRPRRSNFAKRKNRFMVTLKIRIQAQFAREK